VQPVGRLVVRVVAEVDTAVLSTKPMDQMIMEAIKIEQHPNNMKKEDGLLLHWLWKASIHTLIGRRKHRLQDCHSPPGH
jgi:hypothetical protein